MRVVYLRASREDAQENHTIGKTHPLLPWAFAGTRKPRADPGHRMRPFVISLSSVPPRALRLRRRTESIERISTTARYTSEYASPVAASAPSLQCFCSPMTSTRRKVSPPYSKALPKIVRACQGGGGLKSNALAETATYECAMTGTEQPHVWSLPDMCLRQHLFL